MAVIQKIRERYAKLAGFVIALSLVAFIISEGVNGKFGSIFGQDSSVAKVNGEKIEQKDYANLVRDYQSLTELFRKGQPMSETDIAQMRQDVLQNMVFETMIEKQAEKIGLTVSEQEKKDAIYGPEPDQLVRQFPYFADDKGQFDPQRVKPIEKEMYKRATPEAEKAAGQWDALKSYIVRNKIIQKYNALFTISVYQPKFLIEKDVKDRDQKASIRYVKIPYTTVNDNEVKVTDADITAYEQKHKSQYEIDQPTRSIDYVVFDVLPNSDDSAKSLGALDKLRSEFIRDTATEMFVDRNSDDRYANLYVTKKSFASAFADSILNLNVGSVYGPYFEQGNYKLTKVVARRSMPDSVKAQHILIAVNANTDDSAAHKRADSLKLVIQQGGNFDSLASHFSDDQGSKVKGGDLGYFTYGAMVPEFNTAVFEGSTGDLKVVKTQFGYHVIKITDQKNFQPAEKLATVVKALNIGTKANQTVFGKANAFTGSNMNNSSAFDAEVKKAGLNKREAADLKPGDFTIQGVGPARDIIRWAYDAKVGDVSDPVFLNNRYIVSKLTSIQEKGLRTLQGQMKDQVESLVKAEKKAEIIKAKYKAMTSIDAIAQAAAQPVATADSIAGNVSYTQTLGYEPQVIGYSFNDQFKPNTLSPGIKGRDGVFFIMVTQRFNIPSAPLDENALHQQRMISEMQTKNAASSMLQEALKKSSKITYNAKNIF